MHKRDRKAAVAAYKERNDAWGVFAVICNATGQTWVGRSRHVDNHRNGLWFSLDQGTNPHRSLQAAWLLHGQGEFRFEELDRVSEGLSEIGRRDDLKRRAALWTARLKAEVL